MRISHLILGVVAIIACCGCYWFGYRAGTKESPLEEEYRGNLSIALRTYQATERTNWTKVQSTLGMQVWALTRNYDRMFGIPTGTHRFVQQFAEAQAVAKRVEQGLIRINSARDFFDAIDRTNTPTK